MNTYYAPSTVDYDEGGEEHYSEESGEYDEEYGEGVVYGEEYEEGADYSEESGEYDEEYEEGVVYGEEYEEESGEYDEEGDEYSEEYDEDGEDYSTESEDSECEECGYTFLSDYQRKNHTCKFYGYFKCVKCRYSWQSAHAWKGRDLFSTFQYRRD
jgi:ssDNA-binding Zn-finger/Zn-ribbon topoisomerase 1